MKRTQYDSEYDKIRRKAGYTRPQYDFPDDQEADDRSHRIETAMDDFHERMAEVAQAETQVRINARAEMDTWRAKVNQDMIRREYEDLGLTPPEPLVSLALLQRLGWKVEHFTIAGKDRWELIRPPALPAAPKSDGRGQQT